MNKVLLVTGASRGIGKATAQLAADRGYDVCVNYKSNRQAAETLVEGIKAAGRRAVAVAADVAVEDEVMRLFDACDRSLGPLDGLVNNAGILETQMRVDSMDAARLGRVFSTNVIGSFVCAREAVKRMSTRYGGRGGTIVNVSSGASRLGSPNEYVDYAATEVAEEGIRVNAVRAGFIYTDIHASGGEPNRVERVKTLVPMKRGGTAEEVALAILWLLSDEASYTTASFIDVQGGK